MVNKSKCVGCGTCVNVCPVGAITIGADGKAQINKEICIQCGSCQNVCPVEAVKIN